MQGFEIRFNVYADSQQEADLATEELKRFVDGMAQRGIAVTANKIAAAVQKFKSNHFVTNYFR